MTFRAAAAAIRDDLIALRRDLHQHPEIGLQLPRTQEKILEALAGLPLEITLGSKLSSVVAVLRGGRSGPTVLLRGDMDALPVREETGLPYASTNGAMHACGHDLHVASLVGAARLLCDVRDDLPGNVIFMFQPGEEGPGGAALMLEEGLLEAAGGSTDAAYTLHVLSAVDRHGLITTRRGPFMAGCDTLHVTVAGVGGHGSAPFRAKDPLPAACEMVLAIEVFVTRAFNIFDPVVVTVGNFHSGSVDNVIPMSTHFDATIRSFSAEARERLHEGLERTVRGIAAAHDLEVEIDYEWGYPVTVNDPAEAEWAADVVRETFGEDRFEWLENPGAGAEDMAFVQEKVASAYLNLGACPPDLDPATAPNNHSPYARFDDAVVPDGAALLATLAHQRLTRN
jgi:hippurate hydrolase